MQKTHLKLRSSESTVIGAAAQIYAAYIISGKVNSENEAKYREHALNEAIALAIAADDRIISDGEVESSGKGY